MERAPDGVRAALRSVGRGARGGAPQRRHGGRSRASERSICTWRRPGASTMHRSLSVTPVVAAQAGPPRDGRLRRRRRPRPDGRVRRRRRRARRAARAPVSGAAATRAGREGGGPRRGHRCRVRPGRGACRRPPRDRSASACQATAMTAPPARRRWRPATAPSWPGSSSRSFRPRTSVCSRSQTSRARRGRTSRRSISPPRSRPRRGTGRPTSSSIAMSEGRLGHAALPARRAAGGGALRPPRAGRGDLLLGRRSVGATTRARTTRPRWALTTSPASPGCRRSRRATPWRLVSRLSWLQLPRWRAGQRERPARRDVQSIRAGRCAGGAGRADAVERAHRRRRLQPGLGAGRGRRGPRPRGERRSLRRRAARRCWRSRPTFRPSSMADAGSGPAPSMRAIASATASRSATAPSTCAPLAWRPPIRSASRCLRRARCPTRPANRGPSRSRRRWLGEVRGAAARGDATADDYARIARASEPPVPDVAARPGGAVLARAPRPRAGRVGAARVVAAARTMARWWNAFVTRSTPPGTRWAPTNRNSRRAFRRSTGP